jgi:hypothetical protein
VITEDVLDWTDAGRAALVQEAQHGPKSLRGASEDELRARVAGVVSRFVPCWDRGLAKGDDVGRAAVALASGGWEQALGTATGEQLAGIASLLGARGDDDGEAFVELAVRKRGITTTLGMLVAMWSMATGYHDPDWPRSEERLAIWLKSMGPDSSSAQDASVSYAKGDAARYLAARYRDSDARAQRDATSALEALWAGTPIHARAPLALACCNLARAEEIAGDLLDDKAESYPHFAWQTLPALLRDEELLARLHEDGRLPFTWTWFSEMGALALPYYADAIAKRSTGKHQRERMVEQLVNLRGPRAAVILARLAGKAPLKKQVRAYFERHPDLFAAVIRDRSLSEYREALDKLARTGKKKG